jgi:hypothetical protein
MTGMAENARFYRAIIPNGIFFNYVHHFNHIIVETDNYPSLRCVFLIFHKFCGFIADAQEIDAGGEVGNVDF